MTVDKANDALKNYFEDLLSGAELQDMEQTLVKEPEPARTPPSAGYRPARAVEDATDKSHVASSEHTALPRSQASADSSAHMHAAAPAVARAKIEKPEAKQLEQREALREEQKRKLQALLSQQAFRQAKVEAKPELPTSQKVENEQTKPQPAAEAQFAEPLHDLAQGLELTDEAAKSEFGEGFHNEAAHAMEWADNGRPLWAQEAFDALLFDVGGLTLAVPLVSLGQIVPLNKEVLTPIFGQVDWFMGMLSSNLGQLRVVNTALFVMPEKYDERFPESAEYVISLDGVPWALAVNRVNQPVRLNPDEIKWRSERSKRPWLAGTVKTAMCALLDVPKMAHILNESDKQLSRKRG